MKLKKPFMIFGLTAMLSSCSCHPVNKENSQYSNKSSEEMMQLFDSMFELGDYFKMTDRQHSEKKQEGFSNKAVMDSTIEITKTHYKMKIDSDGEGYQIGTKDEFKIYLFDTTEGISDEMLFTTLRQITEAHGENFEIIDDNTIKWSEESEIFEQTYYDYENCNMYCPYVYEPVYGSHDKPTGKFSKVRKPVFVSLIDEFLEFRNLKNHFNWDRAKQRYVYNSAYAEEDHIIDPKQNSVLKEFSIGVANGKIADITFSDERKGGASTNQETITFAYSNITVELPSDDKVVKCNHSYSSQYHSFTEEGRTYVYYECELCGDMKDFHEEISI